MRSVVPVAVATEAAVALPLALEAVTSKVSVAPTSDACKMYVLALAPPIATPARFH